MLAYADVCVALQDKLRAMSAALEETNAELAHVRHARASEAAEHDEQVLLYMCPHTAIYVSSYCYLCPHAAICVLILLSVRPHTAIYYILVFFYTGTSISVSACDLGAAAGGEHC